MERAERQRAVIEEFENLGGVVWYDYQFDSADIPNAEAAEPPGPPWLRRLLGNDFFTNVTKLDLMQTEIGDVALSDLETLTDLQSLSLGEQGHRRWSGPSERLEPTSNAGSEKDPS